MGIMRDHVIPAPMRHTKVMQSNTQNNNIMLLVWNACTACMHACITWCWHKEHLREYNIDLVYTTVVRTYLWCAVLSISSASNRPVLDSGSVQCNPLYGAGIRTVQSTVRGRNPELDDSKRMEIDSNCSVPSLPCGRVWGMLSVGWPLHFVYTISYSSRTSGIIPNP